MLVYIWLYLVVKKKDSNILIYNYIYYSDIFTDSILAYWMIKNNFKNSLTFSVWGGFLTIIDSELAYDPFNLDLDLDMKKIISIMNILRCFYQLIQIISWLVI